MRLTIGRKLSIGFTLLILFFLISITTIYITLTRVQNVNERNSEVYVPSMNLLMELKSQIVESEKLIGTWIFIQSIDDTPDKNRLRELINNDYPTLRDELLGISQQWNAEQAEELQEVLRQIGELFITYGFVMDELSDFMSYDDVMVIFEIRPMMEEGGTIVRNTRQLIQGLDNLLDVQRAVVAAGQSDMEVTLERFRSLSFLLGIIIVVGGIIIASVFVRMITKPVLYLRNILNEMGEGKLPQHSLKGREDEIGDMSKALNFLIEGLKEKVTFASEIGNGNFEHEFKPLSDEDTLGISLVEMRGSLQQAKTEEDKRKIEDTKRNWSTQGVARFAELLRQNNDNLHELSFNIIRNLVGYLEANQGGVFILSEDTEEPSVELFACYAYERRKFLKKIITKGEGLVGTCLQEGDTIYLTDVPDSYINITSGLGDSNPRCILIVPLKLNDEIFGVIEIASFKVLEPHQIEFVEKVAESIASTISSVKINIRTTELLHQSQEQSEEMRAQEEEMRQNMEEMHATQEEMERKEIESEGFFAAMNNSIAFMELSVDCKVKKINPIFAGIVNYSENEVDSLSFFKMFDKAFMESQGMLNVTDTLSNGTSLDGDFMLLRRDGKTVHVKGAFKHVLNKYGAPLKILFVVQKIKE
ncbi:MAG: HAMP domain-containing protein [Bacteroidetes bacterium]|nr:MAG: HAMP domain-containing protein [Bacteroidota bacterium]